MPVEKFNFFQFWSSKSELNNKIAHVHYLTIRPFPYSLWNKLYSWITNPFPLASRFLSHAPTWSMPCFGESKHRAIGTNFPIPRSLHSHTTQFGDGSHKVGVEIVGITGKRIDSGPGPWVRKEDLVGGEKAFSLLKILVIHIVECSWSGRVHVDGYRRIHVSRAHLLQLDRVLPVQCGVHSARRAEVVYSIGEPAAMAESKGVCTCITLPHYYNN